ncbi:response regulator transcription factor [Verrucomicrobiaceae bacterium R5-34]|uniref:Response regulator transcription factor n=1 Tax=Oceaniferula flava TaxID=2800421 RepID=A0AAE2VDC0_9BACT|nr:response regulator transcription factor [Oceaniferula flavus]MBK1830337.1 response regulator transcription factor [Verrucomicrobiaceae bacterium R5-34]MBK1854429.1 response regulator transcription factor [Oceaniferula flavus]MBM1135735.1 response regulator transcription factor [Oceaniferula flavus]
MRILVIEDYAPIRKSIVERLTEDGYTVDSSATGDEGLWYAENHQYDVILLDIMLPEVDGLTILRTLRAKEQLVPIIIMSARDAVNCRIEGLDMGADDYLVKPFSLDELMARIRSQIRKSYDQKNTTFTLADLTLEFRAKRVYRGDVEISLTKREYSILEYLAYRAGEVVSRMEIWNHVYDEYEDSTSNAVDVYVGYLRKKLNIGDSANLIQTRRGVGYYLSAPGE